MKNLEKVLHKASKELNLNPKEVSKAYILYWRYFREYISSIEFRKDMSKNDFDNLHASFNIPSLGKFCCTYDRYLRLKKKEKLGYYAKDNRMCTNAESCDSDSQQI